MTSGQVSASVAKSGLLPPIKPIWDAHIRDSVIVVGGDGNYYMTGSTGTTSRHSLMVLNCGVRRIYKNGIISVWYGALKKMVPEKKSGATCTVNLPVLSGLRSRIILKAIITFA